MIQLKSYIMINIELHKINAQLINIPENRFGGGGPGGGGGAIGAGGGGAGGGGINPVLFPFIDETALPCSRDSISDSLCFVSVCRATSVSSFSLALSKFDSKSSFS